ncbi:FadR/GntR family transcriptional regulator [Rhodococcus jostii]
MRNARDRRYDATVRPVKRISLVTHAVHRLSSLISEGEWPVGSQIPNNRDLSTLLGVSTSTGREAIRVLVASGQLLPRQGSGTFVMSTTPLTTLDRLRGRADPHEINEVRAALEIESARLAASRRDHSDIAALKGAMMWRESAVSPEQFVAADLSLHRAVVRATHNRVFSVLFDWASGTISAPEGNRGSDGETRPGDAKDGYAAHRALVGAIVDERPECAADAMRLSTNCIRLPSRLSDDIRTANDQASIPSAAITDLIGTRAIWMNGDLSWNH